MIDGVIAVTAGILFPLFVLFLILMIYRRRQKKLGETQTEKDPGDQLKYFIEHQFLPGKPITDIANNCHAEIKLLHKNMQRLTVNAPAPIISSSQVQ